MQFDPGRRDPGTSRVSRRAALRRSVGTSAAVVLGAAIQGCGTDEPEEKSTVAVEPTATVPITTLEPMPAPPGSPAATPGATPAATSTGARHIVEMNEELRFDPEELTLGAGDVVVWRTVGAVPHTSTCDPEQAQNPEEHVRLPEGAKTWDSGLIDEGGEFERTFDVPGEYTYFCIPHEGSGMIGYLTVEG